MKTGFVILNFNSSDLTIALAKKISSFDCIDIIVVVDNKSVDGSLERLDKIKSDKIMVVSSGKNGGYSFGNNFGARVLQRLGIDIMVIANPDVDIEEIEIKKILISFQESQYKMLSGVEYDIENRISNPAIWSSMTYKDDVLDCFYIGRKILKSRANEQINYDIDIQPVDLVKGSFFAVKLNDFWEVSGFDENVFLFCEERILARKFKNANKLIGVVTAAKYNHNHSATINREYKRKSRQIKMLYKSRMYYNIYYNNIRIYQKCLLMVAMKISLLEFMIFDFIKSL